MPRSATAGVVAAGDPQTAAAGAALLRAGGNAVDAAVVAVVVEVQKRTVKQQMQSAMPIQVPTLALCPRQAMQKLPL